MPIFVKILLAQIVAMTAVVFVLKKVLDKQLVESAIRQYDFWRNEEKVRPVNDEVAVICHRRLALAHRALIEKATRRRFGESARVIERVDKALWGGVIIRVGATVFDYSLKDRLRQAFLMR